MQQTAGHSPTAASIPIRGLGHVPAGDLCRLLSGSQRCVRFECCVSVVVVTFHYRTAIYLTDSRRSRFLYGLAYSLMTLAFGPWGVPWGPILTVRAVWANLRGGEDMTAQILSRLGSCELSPPPKPAPPCR
ncbi:MAG TPA: hypothetical protein VFG68_14875 [Fimbriiglobus sp.]|nr:hypothetical protein [Fimbriiglobus sp.]